ncbi:unnamed protein product, partial [Prorocentrum cordatum]
PTGSLDAAGSATPSAAGTATPSAASASPAGPAAAPARHGTPAAPGGGRLFRHRIRELHATARSLRCELRQAVSSEAALRRSVQARSLALRDVLYVGATTGVRQGVQCGPLQMTVGPEAEIQALRAAVEEQLRTNLQLLRARGPHAPAAAKRTTGPGAEKVRRGQASKPVSEPGR